jgi:cystathionine gamma-synthase/cystathionine gamma-lyase
MPEEPFFSGFSTRAIRVGQEPDPATGATIPPIYQTATFTLEEIGKTKGFDYSRSINPTRRALERQLAALEGGAFGVAYASGMAACFAATSMLKAGDHIVATEDIYGGTYRLFSAVLSRYNIETTYVDMTDLAAVAKAMRPETKLIWVETPSNPTMVLTDIAAIAELRKPGQLIVADNTLCSPFFQRPLELGVDIVVHSTTKYVAGHSDVIGGILITNSPEVNTQAIYHQNAIGAVPGPMDAFLTMRGVKTLALRMREHERNAMAIAEWLQSRDDVAAVFYPGLTTHPQHELAKKQMHGFGGILSFRPRGHAERAYEIARKTRIFQLATSLGGVESLICSPEVMTHASMPEAFRVAHGITHDLLRLSVGIEDKDDLIADLQAAFDAVPAQPTGTRP